MRVTFISLLVCFCLAPSTLHALVATGLGSDARIKSYQDTLHAMNTWKLKR
jgi:hypothetical protein